MQDFSSTPPVAVVGGGLAGLTAALELARGGRTVVVFEQAAQVGGRAKTRKVQDFLFNLGPRALYKAGHARRILDDLGIRYEGGTPQLEGGTALIEGRSGLLPTGLGSLLTARWVDVRAKLQVARLLGTLPKIDPRTLEGRTAQAWLDDALDRPKARHFFSGFLRLSTYCADLDRIDASIAVRQLQIGMQGVLYLDGGWQTLVDRLRFQAEQAGVRFSTGVRVKTVHFDHAVRAVETADGTRHPVSAAILAVDPETALRLADVPALRDHAENARPIYAACLDVALKRLPHPEKVFALGIDEPYYLSVHSSKARLAPGGGALVHVLRYLRTGERPERDHAEADFGAVLERVQPDWRDHLIDRQLLPHLLVGYMPPAALREEDGIRDLGVAGLRVAGDWAAGDGMLADAAMLSARLAASDLLKTAADELKIAA